MPDATPQIIIIAGPNGAGKTTAAPFLLRDVLGVDEFVNADIIASGLSMFAPERVAMAAGRMMLQRLHELAEQRASFAFETTLASRSYASWLRPLRESGYHVHLSFLWLPTAAKAVQRVAHRVRMGGHHVPEDVIRRRHARGLSNFGALYAPLCTSWDVYDSSAPRGNKAVASQFVDGTLVVVDSARWRRFARQAEVNA